MTGVCGAAVALAGAAAAGASPAPLITATTAPTFATSPTWTLIALSTPAEVAGTSIEVLSVSISNRFSPGFTVSPADLNHFVILPSATVSPSCGIRTSIANSLDPFPSDLLLRIRRIEDQPMALEALFADEVALVTGLHARLPMVNERAGFFVDRVGAEVGNVVGGRNLGLVRRHFLGGARPFDVRSDLHRHF